MIKEFNMALKDIPLSEQTEQLCLDHVASDGLNLEFCGCTNRDIYITAVKQNGLALRFIDEENQTIEIVCCALHQNKDAINSIVSDTFKKYRR